MRPVRRRGTGAESVCSHKSLLCPNENNFSCCFQIVDRYHSLLRKIRYSRNFIAINPALAAILIGALMLTLPCTCHSLSLPSGEHLVAQARVGGLDPNDYIDEAGELDVMANQQQIPTAQLMTAAGHIVPENFFIPGGSIPALHQRYHQQIVGQQQQLQQAESNVQQQLLAAQVQQARQHLLPGALKYLRQADLMAAASGAGAEPQSGDHSGSLIDFNGYNLVAQPDGRDSSAAVAQPVDLIDILGPAGSSQALYEQQQQQQQYALAAEQQMAELAALSNQQHQNQQQNSGDNSAQSSENYGSSIGPAYQISGQPQEGYGMMVSHGGDNNKDHQPQKPYGLPTKSSNKEPSGMLKPLGNPKTVSSPVIDFVANQLPKTTNLEKLADKLPQTQTPTVFSFSSSKDPMEKVKGLNQKKRGVMRQAEQLAKMMIKSVNDKFGTTIGDQTDIPFLLSSFGPLGFAQNILTDPTLLVTLLNSAEKTYFSDVLPGPAKLAMRPVLNIFRVPNKKRDKANLLNIISYLASGGQTPSNSSAKHRQGFGIEKQAKKASNSKQE